MNRSMESFSERIRDKMTSDRWQPYLPPAVRS